jgi:hypothetical protein
MIDNIGKKDIAARLRHIIEAHGPIAAARARIALATMFTWALKEGLCELDDNPVTFTNDPGKGARPEQAMALVLGIDAASSGVVFLQVERGRASRGGRGPIVCGVHFTCGARIGPDRLAARPRYLNVNLDQYRQLFTCALRSR